MEVVIDVVEDPEIGQHQQLVADLTDGWSLILGDRVLGKMLSRCTGSNQQQQSNSSQQLHRASYSGRCRVDAIDGRLVGKDSSPSPRIHYFLLAEVRSRLNFSPFVRPITLISAQLRSIQSAPAWRRAEAWTVEVKAITLAPDALPERTPAGTSSNTMHSEAGHPRTEAPFK